MWIERIFSKGDLSGDVYGEYEEYLRSNYDSIEERLEHVKTIIDRLEFEKRMIEEELEKGCF